MGHGAPLRASKSTGDLLERGQDPRAERERPGGRASFGTRLRGEGAATIELPPNMGYTRTALLDASTWPDARGIQHRHQSARSRHRSLRYCPRRGRGSRRREVLVRIDARSETDSCSDSQFAQGWKPPRAILHAPEEPGPQWKIYPHAVQRSSMDAALDEWRAGTLEAGREVHTCAMLRPVTRRNRYTRAPPVVLPSPSDQQVASPAESRKRPADRGAHHLLDIEVRAGDAVAYLPALVVRVTVAEVVERLAADVPQVVDAGRPVCPPGA